MTGRDDLERAAVRAGRYAVGGVGISVVGNVVHLATKLTATTDPAGAFVAAVTAEALFGPGLVFICSHLLMHADRARPLERVPLWAGFVCGAALSSVHLWALAYSVLATGVLADIAPWLPYAAAALLPVGVEGASIGSIQQAARFRIERDHTASPAESVSVIDPSPTVDELDDQVLEHAGTGLGAAGSVPASSARPESGPVVGVLPFPEPLAPIRL